jgi:hypothetical protein
MTDSPPTDQELVFAIDQLFQAAHRSAVFEYWSMVRMPIIRRLKELDISDAEDLFANAFLENSLILIRKTAEFFKKKEKNDKNDTLYVYRYLPNWSGDPVVGENDYKELHKRIGHLTLRETRHGKMPWEIQSMTIRCIKTWIDFFEKVGSSPIYEANPPTKQLQDYVETLQDILATCVKRQIASSKL